MRPFLQKIPRNSWGAVATRRTTVDLGPKRIGFFRAVELTKVVSSAVLLLAVPLSGCGPLLGIEEKHLTNEVAQTDCPLVTGALPAVRVMNAIPDSTALDLCHKLASKSSYGKAWFAANSKNCGVGVAYTQFTRDLAIEAGTYDFKLVPAGSGCDADGVAIAGVVVKADSSISLMAYGKDLATAQISPLPNRTEPTNAQPVRFVHALNNAGQLKAGLVSTLASNTLGTPLFVNVEYGRASPKSSGALSGTYDDVDEFGYNIQGGPEIPQFDLQFGVQLVTSSTVMLAAPVPVTHGHSYTVFVLGTNGVSQPRPKIWSCDENGYTGLFLTCGNPYKLSVEVFDPNIADAFTPSVGERKGPAIEAILSEGADLLCATELYDPTVVERLRNDNSPVFRYRLFSDDIPPERILPLTATPTGTTPVDPAVACPGEEFSSGLASWLECVKNTPGCTRADPANAGETVLTAPGEMAVGCMFSCGSTGPALAMIAEIQAGGRREAGSCYWCAVTHLASYESFESTLRQCTTEVPEAERSHLAFGGSAGLAVFSREAELGEAELVQLPSSGWQRAAMRVPVTLKNGAVFDYWCTSVRFPNTEDALSYAGHYGAWGTSGSAEEQAFELATAVEVIEKRAQESGVPAIVGVVAHAGPEYLDGATGAPHVHAFAPEIFSIMGAWPELVASDYTPACTFCGDNETNPLNAYGEQYRIWTTHLFGIGVLPSAVESTKRTFMDATVAMTDANGNSFSAPVSQHFGLRSVIKMTQ